MVAFALRDAGWYLRQAAPWIKRAAMPESVTDRPSSSLEYVFMLAKRERYYFDQDAVRKSYSTSSWSFESDVAGTSKRGREGFRSNAKGAACASGAADGSTMGETAMMNAYGNGGRNRRNGDWWYESLAAAAECGPVGMVVDEGGEVLGFDVSPEAYGGATLRDVPIKAHRTDDLSVHERGRVLREVRGAVGKDHGEDGNDQLGDLDRSESAAEQRIVAVGSFLRRQDEYDRMDALLFLPRRLPDSGRRPGSVRGFGDHAPRREAPGPLRRRLRPLRVTISASPAAGSRTASARGAGWIPDPPACPWMVSSNCFDPNPRSPPRESKPLPPDPVRPAPRAGPADDRDPLFQRTLRGRLTLINATGFDMMKRAGGVLVTPSPALATTVTRIRSEHAMTATHPSDGPVYYKAPPVFSRYRVGTDGSVWSAIPPGERIHARTRAWRRLAATVGKVGYPVVTLSDDGRRSRKASVHRLILQVLRRPLPRGDGVLSRGW